jgi:hypothetical protein
MTLLLSWVGKDSRKISSFYIASDSRLSWTKSTNYDYGRKVFALTNSPDILGYCGDVVYPSLILSQIMEMDRDKILFPNDANNQERSEILFREIKSKFESYTSETYMSKTLEIIHVSRQSETNFICNVFSWTKKNGWTIISQEIPDSSDKVIILGSGGKEFHNRYLEYYRGLSGKTSRALFQCLTHSLLKMKDLQCGGSPQLVGLYNRFNGKNFGIIYEGKRYFLGKELIGTENLSNIEWRNELFERSDGQTKEILNGAQRQPDELRP